MRAREKVVCLVKNREGSGMPEEPFRPYLQHTKEGGGSVRWKSDCETREQAELARSVNK
jgi:hypothetical protein